jgi:hypothetical protein
MVERMYDDERDRTTSRAPAATWKLIDELVAVVIDSIIARSVEFAPDLDGLRLTSG